MKNLLVCTNKIEIISLFKEGGKLSETYNFLESVTNKDFLLNVVKKYVDEGLKLTILITEGVMANSGMTTSTLILSIKEKYPEIRIIYIAGEVLDDDVARINILGSLVQNGIYDIYHKRRLNSAIIQDLIDNPKTKDEVAYLTEYLDEGTDVSGGYKNVVMVSSIKPGSGKSMVAVNMAVAIAKYGINTYKGNRPRVAIIEGDLQTLSVGTLLQIENPKHNIREALRAVSRIINEDGYIVGTDEEVEKVQKEVLQCFVRHDTINNLYALAGSHVSLSDLNLINPHHYYFLIQSIVNYFDVIVVDTNSSLEHKSTGPLLELADHCYYLLDLDSNNIRNNIRYWNELKMLNVTDKIMYILNRDISTEEQQRNGLERLSYSAKDVEASGFKLIERIPMMDMSIAYNRIYRGTPVVLDQSDAVKDVRKALINIADTTWHIDPALVAAEQPKGTHSKPENIKAKAKKKKWWQFWKK